MLDQVVDFIFLQKSRLLSLFFFRQMEAAVWVFGLLSCGMFVNVSNEILIGLSRHTPNFRPPLSICRFALICDWAFKCLQSEHNERVSSDFNAINKRVSRFIRARATVHYLPLFDARPSLLHKASVFVMHIEAFFLCMGANQLRALSLIDFQRVWSLNKWNDLIWE